MLFNVEKYFCLYKSIAICNRKYKDIREVRAIPHRKDAE